MLLCRHNIRFYSTYEELKPTHPPNSPAFTLTRFYSTYEELKLLMLGGNFPLTLQFLQYL